MSRGFGTKNAYLFFRYDAYSLGLKFISLCYCDLKFEF